MAEPVKSALFVDYDSIYRSLRATNKDAAEKLASRAGAWVAAIESGRLLTAKSSEVSRRRVLIRRCYGDPRLLGKNRAAFIASGFEVIDSPALDGRERNAADIGMVLDAMDALEHPASYDEFILISADADLTPALLRLRAHNRVTAIYANKATPAAYRALPDSVVEESTLIQILSGEEVTVAKEPQPVAGEGRPRAVPASGPDRGDIELVARKVHNATSVPLFSPRTFADLFRVLAQEVAENGYHFQTTAENVAGKLAAAGRNVTRRQVMFVVKGLALKGHVFSTTESAERLADVFREQVLYLIGSHGLELDAREQGLLASWIVGRVAPSAAVAAEPQPQPQPQPRQTPEVEAKPAEEPKAAKKRAGKPQAQPPKAAPAKAIALPSPPPPMASSVPPPASNGAGRGAVFSPPPPPAQGRTIEEIKAAVAARAAALRPSSASAPVAQQPRPTPQITRPAPAVAPRPALPQAERERAVPPPRPPAARPAPPMARSSSPPARANSPSEANKEALESSILAAIAQAVDVLVEDSGGTPSRPEVESAPPMTSPTPEPKPEPVASDGEDSGDIGDEIQKIIASYSRARQQGEPH